MSSPMTIASGSPIDAAREAFTRHAWTEAYERFTEADRGAQLMPADLERYAETAWWCAQPDTSIELLERSYALYARDEDHTNAARVAIDIGDENANKRAFTIALAWLARAERHLAHVDPGAPVHAKFLLRTAMKAADQGDVGVAIAKAKEALALAERTGERDAQAQALMLQGHLMVGKGDVAEGMKLVDEATMAAVSGDLGLRTTGIVYCNTISACRDIGDYLRASDWTEAAHRWCERQSVAGFPGICRVHRAEVMALRGALAKAEQEARVACDEVSRYQITPIAAEGYYEIGSIRLRMGDLPAAEDAFRQAHALGHYAEPGLSLIRLAEGKAAAAHAALTRILAEARSRPSRMRLLPAAVEVAIAAGDIAAARKAAEELHALAEMFDTAAVHACAHVARGAVLLAEGDADGARRALQSALERWRQVEAPYEIAETQLLLGRAYRALGDEDAARLEIGAAKTTFERIGARRDARIAAEELGVDAPAAGDEARVTRTFLFSDIVNSTSLIGVIGDDAWRDLIRWHDDALRSVVAEHGGEEIRHQGDGFALAFDDADAAIECAIAIQRRLADHRRAHGFAPAVRVGVHTADTHQRGLDYAGVGIHEAARVGALAAGGEILTTRSTLDRTTHGFGAGNARRVELKGIAETVEVLTIAWR